jgi:hypothetical protein
MWFFIAPKICVCVCFFFEQFIKQQMVRFQNSILEHLHHHTFFNMFFNRIHVAHRVQIWSCLGIGVDVCLIVWQVFPSFWLSSLIFFTMFWMWLGLLHPSITSLPPMCVHTSHWSYGYPPFTLHPWQRTHIDPSCSLWHLWYHCMKWRFPHGMKIINTTFNSYHSGIDIVFTKDGTHTLVNLDITNPTCADLFPDLGQLKDLILQMQFKPIFFFIVIDIPLINFFF